jgi:tetratricopeptide (TPR) repeat protein
MLPKDRFKRFTFVSAIGLTLVSQSTALAQGDMCVISRAVDQDIIIQACTRRIQSGSEKGPGLAYAYALRARAARLKGYLEDAITDATKAIELDPSYGLSYYVRAQAYSNSKQYDKAIADYNESLRIRPNDEIALQELGHVYQAKGDYDQADQHYREALSINPRFSWAHNDRCWLRAVFNRDLETGLSECDEALRLDPTFGAAHNSRGLLQLRRGDFSSAVSAYTSALQCNPRSASSYYGRGYARLKTNEQENGEKDISAAKSLQPDIEKEFRSYGLEWHERSVPSAQDANVATPRASRETTPGAPPVPRIKRRPRQLIEVSP